MHGTVVFLILIPVSGSIDLFTISGYFVRVHTLLLLPLHPFADENV